ncbi:MAG: hypothetical protein VX737_01470 [Pseudomonadota bacterium]|nr:hypothetical protein [Pseudomonadota bacterium]
MTAKTHMVVDLDRQIQELKSAVRKAGEVRSSTAKEDFKLAEALFRESRKAFYTEQWSGHHWTTEMFWRGLWSLAKDIDAVVGFLQSVWLRKKITRTAMQNWLIQKECNGGQDGHQRMLRFQLALNEASRAINAAKEEVKGSPKKSSWFDFGLRVGCLLLCLNYSNPYVLAFMSTVYITHTAVKHGVLKKELGSVPSKERLVALLYLGAIILQLTGSVIFFCVIPLAVYVGAQMAWSEKLENKPRFLNIEVGLAIFFALEFAFIGVLNRRQYKIFTKIIRLIWGALSNLVYLIMAYDISLKISRAVTRWKEGQEHKKEGQSYSINLVKQSLSSNTFDWWKFLRVLIYVFLFMLYPNMSFIVGHVLPQWGMSALVAWAALSVMSFIMIYMQTLIEEIQCRRCLAEGQSFGEQFLMFVASSVSFAWMHINNPEFKVYGSNGYAILAELGSYFFSGAVYALPVLFFSGLEWGWAMHLANNLFLCTIIGYNPSPLPFYALYHYDRNKSGFTKKKLSYNSFSQVLSNWGMLFQRSIDRLWPIYSLELFARPRYHVEPINESFTIGEYKKSEEIPPVYEKSVGKKSISSNDSVTGWLFRSGSASGSLLSMLGF